MDDWNAIVGEVKVKNLTGAYGQGKRNERGDRLLEFCICFNHHRRRKYYVENARRHE